MKNNYTLEYVIKMEINTQSFFLKGIINILQITIF